MKRIAFERAMEYLHNIYQIDAELEAHLQSYELKFNNSRHSVCFQSGKLIRVTIKDGRGWYTYKKKTIGVYANGIRVPRILNVITGIIHEYTHAIQYFRFVKNGKKGQRAGELETTLNEHHYMETVSPNTMKQLATI